MSGGDMFGRVWLARRMRLKGGWRNLSRARPGGLIGAYLQTM